LKDWITTDCRNKPSTTNTEDEEIVDAPGNDGNASMLEQVKRPNSRRKMKKKKKKKKKKKMMMMMMKNWLVPFFYVLLTLHLSTILVINQLDTPGYQIYFILE